mgnify:CR=1 FL=1
MKMGPHTPKLRMPGHATARIPIEVTGADIVQDVVLKKVRVQADAGDAGASDEAESKSPSELQLPE